MLKSRSLSDDSTQGEKEGSVLLPQAEVPLIPSKEIDVVKEHQLPGGMLAWVWRVVNFGYSFYCLQPVGGGLDLLFVNWEKLSIAESISSGLTQQGSNLS